MRLLGVKIAFGYSPEARDFAILLRHRAESYDAQVLIHDWPGGADSAGKFEAVSKVPVTRLDVGWRPNFDGRRWRLAKATSWLRFFAALPRMLKAARAYDPDIVYSSQQRWDCLAATYMARHLNKPQIMHLHYTIGPWLHEQPLQRLLTCDHVVTVSNFIRDQALSHGVPPERVTRVWNPMSPFPPPPPGTREAVRDELGLPSDVPVIGMVARLHPLKGQSDAIAACAELAPAHPAARLIIVGDGPARAALEAQCAQTGLRERILFTGRRSDVPRILAGLDIFVHPSRQEPFGLAIAEASAAGLPVVAYGDGAVGEIVSDGETGLLSPTGNTAALAANLIKLLDEPETALSMGAAGRERMAREFRPDNLGRSFSDVVRRVFDPSESISLQAKERVTP